MKQIMYFLFAKKRIGRLEFFLKLIGYIAITILGIILFVPLSVIIGEPFATVLPIVFAIFFGLAMMTAFIRRLNDCNWSGYWLFVAYIPLVIIPLILTLLIKKGTIGINKYGDDPLKKSFSS